MEVMLYSIAACLLVFFLYTTYFKRGPKRPAKSSALKKKEIVDSCREMLESELETLKDDPDAYKTRKTVLLKQINAELSRNIYFDPNEIKALIKQFSMDY